MSAIINRYDFVFLFDVVNGNPNGDPDAGNMPRLDPETSKGLVTDVCLKRKIRNYVMLTRGCVTPHDIYVKEKAVLGRYHSEAYSALGISLGEKVMLPITEEQAVQFGDLSLPEGISIDEGDDEKHMVVFDIDIDKKTVKEWIKDVSVSKDLKKLISNGMKASNARKPKAEEVSAGKQYMMNRFFDIRTFGAVMALKSAPNCGQVRGPVQLAFSRSIDAVMPLDISITRMAVATEAEAEKQGGDNRTMGRKSIVPYGLYRCHGFVSAPLAAQTGFAEDDLHLLWEALQNMFDHDRSAARGEMASRALVVFKHDSAMGNAPAHVLFERVRVERTTAEDMPPRAFSDYTVMVDEANLPGGVTILRKF
jgi:CRISPR-associated protein Csd2